MDPFPRTPARRGRAVPAAVLAGALLLAGCGGSDDDGGTATGTTAPSGTTEAAPTPDPATSSAAPTSEVPPPATSEQAAPQELRVAAVDFGYELPTTELAAGELTIELVNEGGAVHNLVVERDGADVAGTEIIRSGETTTLTVQLEPGEYVFYCSVGNHRGLGMEIPVTVT